MAGLRVLAEQTAAKAAGAKVGVIGLCLTGGFALATAVHAAVAAAVASEPSLPICSASDIDLSPDDQTLLAQRVRTGQLRAMLLRFQGDKVSPCQRLRRYGEVLEQNLTTRCLSDDDADPRPKGIKHHSVLTNHLTEEPGSRTLSVREEVLAFFNWRLRGGVAPTPTHNLPECLKGGCQRGLFPPQPPALPA